MYEMHWYSKPWAPLAAFVILAVAGAIALSNSQKANYEKLYKNNVAACERGNILRQQTNDRLVVIEVQKEVLTKFVRSAYVARRDSAKANDSDVDRKAARDYASYLVRLHSVPQLENVDLVDCEAVIQKP